VHGRGFDFWEAGMDIRCADNLYDSFCAYQTLLIQEFDRMVKEYGFITIDANQNIQSVFAELRTHIKNLFVSKTCS